MADERFPLVWAELVQDDDKNYLVFTDCKSSKVITLELPCGCGDPGGGLPDPGDLGAAECTYLQATDGMVINLWDACISSYIQTYHTFKPIAQRNTSNGQTIINNNLPIQYWAPLNAWSSAFTQDDIDALWDYFNTYEGDGSFLMRVLKCCMGASFEFTRSYYDCVVFTLKTFSPPLNIEAIWLQPVFHEMGRFLEVFGYDFWRERLLWNISTAHIYNGDCNEVPDCSGQTGNCEDYEELAYFPMSGMDHGWLPYSAGYGDLPEYFRDTSNKSAQTVRTTRAFETASNCTATGGCYIAGVTQHFDTPIKLCSFQADSMVFLNASPDLKQQNQNSSKMGVFYKLQGDETWHTYATRSVGIGYPNIRRIYATTTPVNGVTDLLVLHRSGGSYAAIVQVVINPSSEYAFSLPTT